MFSSLEERLDELHLEVPERHHRILVVDDEQENLDVLTAVLEDDWEVHAALSGEEALETIASQGEMDLVIADQRMPGITGVELLARIADESPRTVRIVLTAYSDVEPMLLAINRGEVYRFLLKPFEAAEIQAVVRDGLAMQDRALLLEHLAGALSERKADLARTLDELRDAQAHLLAAERLATVGSATSGLVHDLRNMMTVVSLLLAVIEQRAGDDEITGPVGAICDLFQQEIHLLEKVREFSRSGEPTVERAPTDVPPLLEQVLTLHRMEPGGRENPVVVDVQPEAGRLDLDAGRIRHAVLALLGNATRASAPDVPINLAVRCEAPGWACIEVRDQGRGMDAETLARSTQPFFSGFVPPGLGLGLEVARLCAAAHGGRFEIDCPGTGTRARLLLPIEGGAS
jgi:signal transduction histidine kinase